MFAGGAMGGALGTAVRAARGGGGEGAHQVGCQFARLFFGGAERVVNLGRVIAEEADFVELAVADQV